MAGRLGARMGAVSAVASAGWKATAAWRVGAEAAGSRPSSSMSSMPSRLSRKPTATTSSTHRGEPSGQQQKWSGKTRGIPAAGVGG